MMDESRVNEKVRKKKVPGQILISFFADETYGWFKPSQLVSFEEEYTSKALQKTTHKVCYLLFA